MATHNLKLDTKFFDDVKNGVKNFEIRKDDRGFKVGDTLVLYLWADVAGISGYARVVGKYDDGKKMIKKVSEYKADKIIAKVTGIWDINNMFNENGYVDDIENAIDLDLYEKILVQYFQKDTLPLGYVVMGIEVVEWNEC